MSGYLLAAILGFVALALWAFLTWRENKMLRHAVEVEGTIVAFSTEELDDHFHRQYRITVRFMTNSGVARSHIDAIQKIPLVGAKVRILYTPDSDEFSRMVGNTYVADSYAMLLGLAILCLVAAAVLFVM